MKNKKNCGVTLIELIITISLLALVSATVGSVLFGALQSFVINKRLQEDQYNARLALLAVTREAHRGTAEVDITDDENGNSILKLTLNDRESTVIEFKMDNGMLNRTIISGSTPIPFASANLTGFKVTYEDDRWLDISISCSDGLELRTRISVSRIPEPVNLE